VALIGREWLTITDEIGRRRIDDPSDFVRKEIETAKALDVEVIPLLASDVTMPNADDLPKSLRFLVDANAIPLRSDPDFRTDFERLIRALPRPEEEEIRARALVEPVRLRESWDDLVIPEETRQQLKAVVGAIRYQADLDRLGFGGGPGSQSLVVMTGPSGTGKHLATRIVADDLELELYKYSPAALTGAPPERSLLTSLRCSV
jgi:hypothetical protein